MHMRTDYAPYREAWAAEPKLIAARPAYEEMSKTVEKYVSWLEIMVDDSIGAKRNSGVRRASTRMNPTSWLGPIWVLAKMFLFVLIFIWIRATLPRLRYDQLMAFGWKILLPLATLNALVTAILVVIW